jgi:hypothetical protein
MYVHVKTQDIFCDESYEIMAQLAGVCGQKEMLGKLPIYCERTKWHKEAHAGVVEGLPLEWQDTEEDPWDV